MSGQADQSSRSGRQSPAPASSAPVVAAAETARRFRIVEPARRTERPPVNIGKAVVIKGELSGSEDLTIEGQVEGKIGLRGRTC